MAALHVVGIIIVMETEREGERGGLQGGTVSPDSLERQYSPKRRDGDCPAQTARQELVTLWKVQRAELD